MEQICAINTKFAGHHFDITAKHIFDTADSCIHRVIVIQVV